MNSLCRGEATELREAVRRAHDAVQALWSPRWQQYVSRDAISGDLLDVPTSAGLLTASAGFPKDIAPTLDAWLAETPYGIASTPCRYPGFEALRNWRGPVWQYMNLLIATGLREQGHAGHAEAIRLASLQLLEASGLREYFDPVTGVGLGGEDFSWTAATYLPWLAD